MDQFRTSTSVHESTLVSSRGELFLETVTIPEPGFPPGHSLGHALPTQYGPRAIDWQFAGLGAGRATDDSVEGPIQYHTYELPLWLILVVTSILPVFSWDTLFPCSILSAPADSAAEA